MTLLRFLPAFKSADGIPPLVSPGDGCGRGAPPACGGYHNTAMRIGPYAGAIASGWNFFTAMMPHTTNSASTAACATRNGGCDCVGGWRNGGFWNACPMLVEWNSNPVTFVKTVVKRKGVAATGDPWELNDYPPQKNFFHHQS